MILERKIRILVAENDPAFARMLDDSLKESGNPYHVEKVSSGQDCLQKLRQKKFDILLLDHDLSDGKSLTWLQRFNNLGIGIPTIFVTARGDSRLALEAMKEGVFDYVNRSAECAKAFPFVVHRAIEGHSLMLEKVRLQKELIETKNFLESVIEKAGDAISVFDLQGKILSWNEGAEKIYGFRKEEILGKKFPEVLYPDNPKSREEEEKLLDQLMARVKQGEAVSNVEVRRRTKDGREITTSMTLSPLKDSEGKIIGASRICRDITHLKKAEERLIQAERLSSLGELSAGVAHEIRNPLAGIKINAQVLSRKKDLTDTDRRILESTREGIEKIQKIVDGMLHFARPKPAHFREENINEVIEKSLPVLQAKLRKGDISLKFERGEGLRPLRIDVHQIQQVLLNLLLNAIQAMEKGGTLTIRTFPETEGGVGVTIRDTGVGIPPANVKKIFDPFFTTKSEGTGLGLSISMKILDNHRASLDVESEEGKGSAFTLHFPGGEILGV
jgi:two-component system, NtrC family, sensor kinase